MADLMRMMQQMQTQMENKLQAQVDQASKMQTQTNQLIATVNALTESKAGNGKTMPNVAPLPGAQFGATDVRQKLDDPNDPDKSGIGVSSKPPKGPNLPITEVIESDDET